MQWNKTARVDSIQIFTSFTPHERSVIFRVISDGGGVVQMAGWVFDQMGYFSENASDIVRARRCIMMHLEIDLQLNQVQYYEEQKKRERNRLLPGDDISSSASR